MGAGTKIGWCDDTFNPWIGCTKVSPGCDHCYAEAQDSRGRWGPGRGKTNNGATHWGAGVPRHRTAESTWRQPIRWNREAAASGKRRLVFCASLADVFDNEVPQEWRDDLFELIVRTPALTWLLLTKRIGNATKMLRDTYGGFIDLYTPRPNVWLGASVVNQEEANRDIPKLLATPAAKHFLSLEPMLGPIDLSYWLKGDQHDQSRAGVHGATRDRCISDRRTGKDLEAQTANSREPYRDAAVLERGRDQARGEVDLGRVSDGDVLGRRGSLQGVRASSSVDVHDAGGHPAWHGSQPRERQAERYAPDQSDADDAFAEHDPRHSCARAKAEGPARLKESAGAPDCQTGAGHPQPQRKDGSVAARGNVRRDADDDLGHRYQKDLARIDWVICGGESGPKARPFDIAWARSTVEQCKAAGVPVFVKQLGSKPGVRGNAFGPIVVGLGELSLVRHPKGEDPSEWPEDIRVQEFPT